jgi:uncharacterized membrane protein
MNTQIPFFFLLLLIIIPVGGIFLLYPLIVRKGLLFGVYVGEKVFEGEEARRITRSWYFWMITMIVTGLLAGVVIFFLFPGPLAMLVPLMIQLLAFLLLYLRAYYQARALAPAGPPPMATAPMGSVPSTSLTLPLIAIALALLAGIVTTGYAWMHYADLPARVPTHFGPSGKPDAWKPKSFSSVMLLPVTTLLIGIIIAGSALLTARAKRAIRLSDRGVSLQAQLKFRGAMTKFLSIISILTVAMMSSMSIASVRVGLGMTPGLPKFSMILGIVMAVGAIGGVLFIAIRYGQGGARLERASADTPLTDGLADNRNWVLGMFYVNRDDPSIFVERRFGFGYTLNFGNWKAVVLLVVLLGALFAIMIGSARM